MPALRLGPLLRWIDDGRAVVQVQADRPAQVEVRAGTARGRAATFAVAGRHHAVVVVEGIGGGTSPYQVLLDGEPAWPPPSADRPFPAPVLRSPDRGRRLRVVLGSCRVASDELDDPVHGVDALDALARRLARGSAEDLPDLLLLVGDQVYADAVRVPVHGRRPRHLAAPPPGSVADMEEYGELYERSWSVPAVRWLLSTVPSAMVFDDHDVIDDWNTSARWLADAQRHPWWEERIVGGLGAYWLHQHLGNLSPDELASDAVLAEAVARRDDATEVVRALAEEARLEHGRPGIRWSHCRDLVGSARARLVVADCRGARDLRKGSRRMVGEDHWPWIADRVTGGAAADHLLLGASLPWLLPEAVHELEAASTAVSGSRVGAPVRRVDERLRRAVDLEHWAAFRSSFEALTGLLTDVASGAHGPTPGSLLVCSGDVHFSYLAELDPPPGARCPIVQVTSSPLRSGVENRLRRMLALATSPLGTGAGRAVRPLPPRRDVRWSLAGPWFGNGLATIELDGRRAEVRFARVLLDDTGQPRLAPVHEAVLAGG